jgi:hypothetical protein
MNIWTTPQRRLPRKTVREFTEILTSFAANPLGCRR